MSRILEFLAENKEWIFSGLAPFLLGVAASMIANFLYDKLREKPNQIEINRRGNKSITISYPDGKKFGVRGSFTQEDIDKLKQTISQDG